MELLMLMHAAQQFYFEREAIQADDQHILVKLEETQTKLQQLGAQLDEQVLRDMRTGMRHLVDALNSDLDDVRADELRMARSDFNRLLSLDPSGTTRGLSGEVPNSHLIALGYRGNAHYFNLRGDLRNALLQAYECTQKFPLLGLAIFPSEFFSRSYLEEIVEASAKFEALKKQRDDGEWNNFLKGVSYYGKQTLRWLGGGTVAFFAFALHPGLGFATLAAMSEGGISVPKYDDVKSLEKAIASVSEQLEQIAQDLDAECEVRIAELQKVTLDDLRKMSLGGRPAERKGKKALPAGKKSKPSQELTPKVWFRRGFEAKDLDEKLRCFTEALRLDPEYVEAYTYRGIARYRKGALSGAVVDFDTALRLNPQDDVARRNRELALKEKQGKGQ